MSIKKRIDEMRKESEANIPPLNLLRSSWGIHLFIYVDYNTNKRIFSDEIVELDFCPNNTKREILNCLKKDISKAFPSNCLSNSIFKLIRYANLYFGFTNIEDNSFDEFTDDELVKMHIILNTYIIPMQQHPMDYMGELIQSDKQYCKTNSFFPTPQDICSFMTRLNADSNPNTNITDPCCGTGRFLLEASNYTRKLSGQDIDANLISIAIFNLKFYNCIEFIDKERAESYIYYLQMKLLFKSLSA